MIFRLTDNNEKKILRSVGLQLSLLGCKSTTYENVSKEN